MKAQRLSGHAQTQLNSILVVYGEVIVNRRHFDGNENENGTILIPKGN